MNIQDFAKKLNTQASSDAVFFPALIILIGIASFALGQWSASDKQSQTGLANIEIKKQSANIADATQKSEKAPDNTARFVASVNSDKYHLPDCPGALNIKEENKIWFDTVSEAEEAGYSKAGNCEELDN